MAKQRRKVPSWDELRPSLSDRFYEDARSVEKNLVAPAHWRAFLWELAHSGDTARLEVLSSYSFGISGSVTPVQALALKTAAAIERHVEHCRGEFEEDWPRIAKGALSTALTLLRSVDPERYPPFEKALLKVERGRSGPAVSLATYDWEELRGVEPRRRDSVALQLVGDSCLKHLERGERIFVFGQGILSSGDPSSNVDRNDWLMVKHYLETSRKSVLTTGLPRVDGLGALNNPDVWIGAGLPADIVEDVVVPHRHGGNGVRKLTFSCLGASRQTTAAVKLFFCTAVGWNREQINTLLRDPFAFRYEDAAGICSAAFLASFKARAGHFVSAYIERGITNFQPSRENLISLWNETDAAADWREADERDENEPGRLILTDKSVISTLDRFSKLTVPLRSFDVHGTFNDRFFLSLGREGLSGADSSISAYRFDGILGEPGVTYQNTRQSFANTVRRTTGSVALTSSVLGNSPGILLQHYDDRAIQQELEESVAFWANCIQTSIVDGSPHLAAYLSLTAEDYAWYRHLSIVAGISASLLVVGRRLSVHEPQILEFHPSLDAMVELYLIRRGAIAARRRVGENRWRIQVMPILAITTALRRQLRDAGLIETYAEAVRTSVRRLLRGEIAVPKLSD